VLSGKAGDSRGLPFACLPVRPAFQTNDLTIGQATMKGPRFAASCACVPLGSILSEVVGG
jgi:hypothetical protein